MNTYTRDAIREAFHAGTLQVVSVDPTTGMVCKSVVADVMRHHTPHKPLVQVILEDGREVVCTIDHSLFQKKDGGVVPIEASTLAMGSGVTTIDDQHALDVPVASCNHIPPVEYTYDLSVPGAQNFMLSNGILAHNSYSIGGVSLDIEKASKYESLKQNAEGQFDKATEAKARTVKYIRGLQQPRFGIGVRSAFGPFLGKGVMSPRAFIVLLLSVGCGSLLAGVLNHASSLSTLLT